jgi:hypothetical protein
MSEEDAREFRAVRDLELWKEAIDVAALFRYEVSVVMGPTFYCNSIKIEEISESRTEIHGEDCWIYDALAPTRVVGKVSVVAREFAIIDKQRD